MGTSVKVTASPHFQTPLALSRWFHPRFRGRPSHECHWVCGDCAWTICQTRGRHLKQLLAVQSISRQKIVHNWEICTPMEKPLFCFKIMSLRIQLTVKQHNSWLWNSDLSRSGFGSADSHWDAYHAEQKTIPHPPHSLHLKHTHTHTSPPPPPYSHCILFGISRLVMTSARHRKLDLSWYAKANAKQTSHRHTRARLFPIISL